VQRRDRRLRRLADPDAAELVLVDLDHQPEARQVGEEIEIGPLGDVLTLDRHLLQHDAGDRRRERHGELRLGASFEGGDLSRADPPEPEPVARGRDEIVRRADRLGRSGGKALAVLAREQVFALRRDELRTVERVERRTDADLLSGEVRV
jgi:hypothetical protein